MGQRGPTLRSQGSQGSGCSGGGLAKWRDAASANGRGAAPQGHAAVGKLDCHMQPRSTMLLPPRCPCSPKTPMNCVCVLGGDGLSECYLFAWVMSPSRRGCEGEMGGNCGAASLPSEGRVVGYKGVSEEFRKVTFVFCGR